MDAQKTASDKLPSEQIYDVFDGDSEYGSLNGGRGCCRQAENDVGDVLQMYFHGKNQAKKVIGNYCYACKMNHDSASNVEWCLFFYYWLGSKINASNRESIFWNAMKAVYEELKKLSRNNKECKNKCSNIYDNSTSWDIFENGKKLFDYYYDYSALQKQPNCSEHSCRHKYTQYKEEAKKSYTKLKGICDLSGDNYCDQFKRDSSKYNNGNISPLPCTKAPEEEPTLTVAQLKDLKESSLPSHKDFYSEFEEATGRECTSIKEGADQLKNKIESVLINYTGLQALKSLITNAYCRACQIKKNLGPNNDTPCRAFYHWVEKEVPYGDNSYTLLEVLGRIYSTLDDATHKDYKCNVNYKDAGKEISKSRKIVFNHYYNCKDVQQYLQQRKGTTYDDDWGDYKYNIDEACKEVEKYCQEGGRDDPYCGEYENTYKPYCKGIDDKPITCPESPAETVHETTDQLRASSNQGQVVRQNAETHTATTMTGVGPESSLQGGSLQGAEHHRKVTASDVMNPLSEVGPDLGLEGHPEHRNGHLGTTPSTLSTESTTGSVAPAAVSGALATIGIPTALFFLYKYTNLFSGLSGNSPKRKRRSTNSNFDNTSNDDDTSTYESTYDSTDTSTEVSTVASVTDASTVYNERPRTRAARANNRQQQGQRKNIAYHRM